MRKTVKSTRTAMTLTALLLSGLHAMAQNTSQGIIPDVPPSPQAVAFNRLGDYQVSNNYGVPDISIPLFEIDFHGYKIPLTLQYEATPLRPGYNYDVTGVGWTLSGNSCVSRTIKDIADECASTPFTLDGFQLSSGSDKEYLYYHYNHLLDQVNFQYDSYNIVLPSGRTIPFFMYKTDGVMTYHLMSPDENVKILCSYSPNSINAFTVTDESGVTYNFTMPEKAANIYQDDPNADRYVTWLLTSIVIPAKGTIYYQYTDASVVINTHNIAREPVVTVCRLYDSQSVWPNEQKFKVKGYFQSQSPRYEMRFLRHIIYGPTTVDFNYTTDGQHMREIVVSENNDTIRKFTLNVYGSPYYPNWHLNSLAISGRNNEDRLVYGFSYFNNNAGNYTDYWGNCCNAGPILYGDNGQTINNYGLDDLGNFNMFFAYDGSGWDWNGLQYQVSHNGILSQLIENEPGDHYYYYKLKLQTTTEGDTRIPTTPDKHGVLNAIIYPNGGHTTFNWENHSFPTATAADGDIVYDRRSQRIIHGGGFRIESIINWTADGQIASEDYYRYGFTLGDVIQRNFPLPLPDYINTGSLTFNDTINHHIGCGEAVVDPNLFTFMGGFSYSKSLVPDNNSTYSYAAPGEFRKMLVGQDSRFKNISQNQGVQGVPVWWEVTFSANKFRSLIGGRRPVVYPEITVYHGQPFDTAACKSKTVYKYDIYGCQEPNTHYLSSFQETNLSDTAYFEPLYFNNSYPALSCYEYPADRHQLKSKSDYSYNAGSGSWELVSEEKYEYETHNLSRSGFLFESIFSRENYYPNYENLTYNQIGFNHPLSGAPLRDFYKNVTQTLGRSTMSKKFTTTLRHGGTRTGLNTLTDSIHYLYPGVMRVRLYPDLLRDPYYNNNTYDKVDSCSYVCDMDGSNPVIAEMYSRNMLAYLVSAETYTAYGHYSSSMLSGTKIDYASFGNDILPSKLYERNGDVYEESVEVLSYDTYGNPTETVDLRTGMHSTFLWDPYGRYMTAMIRNATLTQVQGVLSQLTGNSQSRYATLKTLLPDTQVQTWDYLPLTGVSSHTDAGGQTTLYEYDGLGRLKSEKRVVNGISEPELLREYEYNYMNPTYY